MSRFPQRVRLSALVKGMACMNWQASWCRFGTTPRGRAQNYVTNTEPFLRPTITIMSTPKSTNKRSQNATSGKPSANVRRQFARALRRGDALIKRLVPTVSPSFYGDRCGQSFHEGKSIRGGRAMFAQGRPIAVKHEDMLQFPAWQFDGAGVRWFVEQIIRATGNPRGCFLFHHRSKAALRRKAIPAIFGPGPRERHSRYSRNAVDARNRRDEYGDGTP